MGYSTRKKRAPKRVWDARAEEVVKDAVKDSLNKIDEAPEAPKAKKSAPRKTTISPLLLGNAEDPPPKDPPPTKEKPPLHVDPPVYSIETKVLWKGKEVRTDVSSSKAFDFYDFTVRAVKVVD